MEKLTLDNGLDVYICNIESAKTITYSVYVKTGSYHEKKNWGIAHLLEHMIFKGTPTRTAREINEEIESYGGYLNAETSFEHTRYFATIPVLNWDKAVDIISDIVVNPIFPEKEFILEKKVVQEELKMYHDDTPSYVQDTLFKEMHPSYVNRQTIGGTVESVGETTLSDLIDFKEENYIPSNMFIVVSGKTKEIKDKLIDKIENYFLKLKNNELLKNNDNFVPDNLDSRTITDYRYIDQAHLSYGLFIERKSNKDIATAKVVSNLLQSRLFQIVREEKGLCYTIDNSFIVSKDVGFMVGYSGLESDCIDEVKDIIVYQFEELVKGNFNDAELKRSIEKTKGMHIISFENISRINNYVGDAIINDLILDPDEYVNLFDSVTKEDIMEFSTKNFTPDNWLFTQVLPKRD